MTKYAKKINASDNVITLVSNCERGDEVVVKFQGEESRYICNQDVPFGHKIAIRDINAGEQVIKYGKSIGSATVEIKTGNWVHVHNVKDEYKCLDKDGKPLPGQR